MEIWIVSQQSFINNEISEEGSLKLDSVENKFTVDLSIPLYQHGNSYKNGFDLGGGKHSDFLFNTFCTLWKGKSSCENVQESMERGRAYVNYDIDIHTS